MPYGGPDAAPLRGGELIFGGLIMTDEDKQCPLAHDSHGEPLVLPDTAVFWRVRRGQAGVRGRPPYAYGKNGAPVVVPIDADADALRAAGLPAGSYRLEALDAEYHV